MRLAGFNEAAGIPRGRLALLLQPRDRVIASMRPRVFPAEDRMRHFDEYEDATLELQ